MTDADKVAMLHPSPTASTGRLMTKTAAQVWEWIKGKGDAVFAAKSHQHGAADITSGTLPIALGGTGAATAEAARAALGASSQADTDALRESLSQALPIRRTNQNPDTITTPCIDSINGINHKNMPIETWFIVFTLLIDNNRDYMVQIAVTYYECRMYVRGKSDGKWGDWKLK